MTPVHDDAAPAPRILLLEDSDIDAQLLLAYLDRSGLQLRIERAVRRSEFEAALQRDAADLVLADYSLPDFDGLAALRMTRRQWPGVPFIFVSGVLGEDIALQALREGATDYLLKRNLAALPAVVRRALDEARERLSRQRAEMLFRMAAQAADIGVWDHDPATRTLWFDANLRALLGLGPKPQLGLDFVLDEIVHADDRAAVAAALAQAADGGADVDITHRVRHQRSGRLCWLALKGRRLSGPDNAPRLVGTARDVSDERRRSETLQQSNQALEERVAERTRERDRIWNLSVDLMLVCRPDGTLAEVNPAWQRMLGRDPARLVGRPLAELVHPDDRGAVRDALQATASGGSMPALASRVQHAVGGYRWVRWTGSADAGLVYAVGRDISDERTAAEELAAANRELQAQVRERDRVEATLQQMQRLEAVGQLTSGVAHDFNNLLAVVLSNISLIRRLLALASTAPDPRVLQRLESMQNAAERGSKLVSQLLAFSRRQRLEPTLLDLNDVVGGMRDLLQTTIGGTVRLEADLDPSLWTALADPTQLELIVLNLAINARDAMEVGGALTVRTRNATLTEAPRRPEEPDPGDYVQLTVADSGSGIPPDVLDRVFEPFFTTKGVGRGSGLGLAQVFGFAKQSGGGVRIETAIGLGTAVHVYVPRARDETLPAPTRDAAAAAPPLSAGGAYTLLLVDDDEALRDVTAEIVAQHGYRVLQAASGEEALAVVDRERDIDLVLADFAMPGMNGAELRRRLLQRHPSLRVAILTGYADLGALSDVPEDMVLQKPLFDDQLVEHLRRWLPQRHNA